MDETVLLRKIEMLRMHLVQLFNEQGTFQTDEIIEASQRLDKLLVMAQRQQTTETSKQLAVV